MVSVEPWDRNPDRRMRLLIGPRPQVDPRNVVVLALEGKRPGPGPSLHDQVVRLVEALVRLGRIRTGRMIFDADAADEACDEASAGNVVEDGEFLGDAERIEKWQVRPSMRSSPAWCGATAHRQHAWRRHQAIRRLMVLVHAPGHRSRAGRQARAHPGSGCRARWPSSGIVGAVGQRHPGSRYFSRTSRSRSSTASDETGSIS